MFLKELTVVLSFSIARQRFYVFQLFHTKTFIGKMAIGPYEEETRKAAEIKS